MEKLTNVFLSKILYKKVFDEDDDCIGKLWDIYVTTEEGYPKAIGYRIKKGGELQDFEFNQINYYDDGGKIQIKVKGVKEIIPRTYSYLLSKNLLDRQIVDINGKKVVRVNDLQIAIVAGKWRVMAVDCGVISIWRRLGIEGFAEEIYKMLNKKPADSLILWDNVESIEMVDNNLKLAVAYNKLSKLHPADLADILEDMDFSYRKKVFEGLDKNLAADTLEEIDPEVQASIIENLSDSKVAEVFDSVPNDEIADMLDEVDNETAEKILLTMEKEDADEIRELMSYKDDFVGSIMNTDYIAFNVNITVEETIELLRELKPEDEVSHYIYVVDMDEKPKGIISLRDLIVSSPERRLQDIMVSPVLSIKDNEKIEEAVEIAVKYNLLSVPVIDIDEKLCGIVVINDIMDEILIPSWKKKFRKAI